MIVFFTGRKDTMYSKNRQLGFLTIFFKIFNTRVLFF